MTDTAGSLPFGATEFTLKAEGKLHTFIHPSSTDAVLDSVPESAYEKDKFLPYWAEHWPSAGAFFSFILQRKFTAATCAVELGTGLGVLTTALSVAGACTTGLDISPDSCRYAASNMRRNSVLPRITCADWRALPFKNRFDLLIASDVLYEERWIPVILDSIESLVKPGGYSWIADPCRRFWVPFKNAAHNRGFSLQTVHGETVPSGMQIEIIELRKDSGGYASITR